MTNGSKEVVIYQMIKIGESFIEKISTSENFDRPGERVLRDLTLTTRENKARKWYFENRSPEKDLGQHEEQKHFEMVKEVLERNGINFKVVRTKITTTTEQEELESGTNENDIVKHVINHFYNIATNSGNAGLEISSLMKEVDKRLRNGKDNR